MMKVSGGILVAALAIALSGCAGGDSAGRAESSIAGLLPPAADLADWRVADGPSEYVPETLFEYLNGGAERYVSHGFRRLVHVRYQHGEDPSACVTLDLFDMGSELGAFGIYSAGRPRGSEPRRWGAEGYQIDTIAAAYRGSIYVHLEADDDRDLLMAMLARLMSRVMDEAAGPVAPPAILARLPAAHLVPRSERYVPCDLLGHACLPGGVLAAYEIDGETAELFFSDVGTGAEAIESLEVLRRHFTNLDAVVAGPPPLGRDGFRFSGPVLGEGMVVRDGALIAGIQGDPPREVMEEILGRLITNNGGPNRE
jgi:hypothetical protein